MRPAKLIVIRAAACLLPGMASAQTAQSIQPAIPPLASLQDAAVELGRRYDSDYREKDVAGMADLYAPDGELVSPGGKVIIGRDALKAYYLQRFASGATDHKITVDETHPVGNTGYSVSTFSVSVPGLGDPPERHVERGHIAAVYAHDATGWHFALVQPSVAPTQDH